VNNAWLLSDAHLAQGNTASALAVYRAVTQTCVAPDVLIATIEKAAAIAPTDVLAELSDIAQAQAPEAATRIRQVEDRLRAGRQEELRWTSGDQVIALELASTAAPSATSERAVAIVAAPSAPARTQNATPAGAPAPAASNAAAPASAPAAAPAPASGGGGATLAAVRAAAERGNWAQCLSLSAGASQLDVVFQRGWCAYNADRALEAISAFDDVARRTRDQDMRREASYGLLLSMLRMNMTEQAAQIAAAAPLTRPQRIEVEGQILDQRGVRAYESGDYARAAAFFQAHSQLTGTTRRDLALLHGYALLNSGDRNGALAIFERLHRQLATAETRQALRAAR
jgi:tetratricopeptide (TPR) repeat protein